jgi:hypothetical protein
VVVLPQGDPHLLEEVIDLDVLERALHELVDLGQDVLLPVTQQVVLLGNGGVDGQQVV